MPVLKHAKKKLRQDVQRTLGNKKAKETFKKLVKKAKASPTKASMSAAFKALDKAAKVNVIHPNKAARLKSILAKGTTATPAPKPGAKKTVAQKAKANKSTKASRAATKKASSKSSK